MGDGTPDLRKFAKPVLRAHLKPDNAAAFKGRKAVAFAGIGRPEKFFKTLWDVGATLVATQAFGDHHAYTAAEIARLKSRARTADAMLVTTEKDYVRLTAAEREGIAVLPVHARFDDETMFAKLLDSVRASAIPRLPE